MLSKPNLVLLLQAYWGFGFGCCSELACVTGELFLKGRAGALLKNVVQFIRESCLEQPLR